MSFFSCVILGKSFEQFIFLYLHDQGVNTYVGLLPMSYTEKCQAYSSKGSINIRYEYYFPIINEEMGTYSI